MRDGSWTIEPCEYAEVKALADELELGEVTASILVRRGYADVEEARRFVRGEIEPHDPFLLGDMAVAVERIRAAIAAGKRICVHGDYDVDGICATSLAVLTLRELGADVEWHLPSRFEEGYGVSGDTISRLADEGCALLLTVDCGITAVEEVAAAKARGLEVIVTDHHRPGAVLPDCPIVATRPSDYPVPGALRHRRRLQARAGARRRRRAVSRPRRAGDDRRRRAAAGREPLARDRGPSRARAHAAPRPAGADAERPRRSGRCRRRRRRLPARAEDQRRRPPRPPRRRARAPAHDGCGRGQASRRRAGDPEPRPSGRRGPDPARGRRRGRVVARGEAPPAWLRDLGRGLARRRDRDRRLAAGRALQPAGRPDRRWRRRLEGLGPLAAGVRPARRARRVRAAPEALRRPSRRCRPLDRAVQPGGVRGRVRRRTQMPCSRTTISRP